ncbi:hypothetical protein COO60DRAFT_1222340 [Scenedesmus sp. NREL 46B-D3]|nr:hypothetical protein COO60DRAFT_1222340 [Scenedesmus sp. NREL 46B-D3]
MYHNNTLRRKRRGQAKQYAEPDARYDKSSCCCCRCCRERTSGNAGKAHQILTTEPHQTIKTTRHAIITQEEPWNLLLFPNLIEHQAASGCAQAASCARPSCRQPSLHAEQQTPCLCSARCDHHTRALALKTPPPLTSTHRAPPSRAEARRSCSMRAVATQSWCCYCGCQPCLSLIAGLHAASPFEECVGTQQSCCECGNTAHTEHFNAAHRANRPHA